MIDYHKNRRVTEVKKDRCMYLRLSAKEVRMIEWLSEKLGRNKTDVIRYAVGLLAEWYGTDVSDFDDIVRD